MKHLIIAILSLIFVTSCTNQTPPQTQATVQPESAQVQELTIPIVLDTITRADIAAQELYVNKPTYNLAPATTYQIYYDFSGMDPNQTFILSIVQLGGPKDGSSTAGFISQNTNLSGSIVKQENGYQYSQYGKQPTWLSLNSECSAQNCHFLWTFTTPKGKKLKAMTWWSYSTTTPKLNTPF